MAMSEQIPQEKKEDLPDFRLELQELKLSTVLEEAINLGFFDFVEEYFFNNIPKEESLRRDIITSLQFMDRYLNTIRRPETTGNERSKAKEACKALANRVAQILEREG